MNLNKFPYYPTDCAWREKEFNSFMTYNPSLWETDIPQSMHGLALAWSYMPHAFFVKCSGLKSPLETFNTDKDLIRKKMKQMDMRETPSGLRKTLKMMTGSQSVSNFRPTAAYSIYRRYMPENGLTWDMSAGYGGRLLGAIRNFTNYIATEPCQLTYDSLNEIINDFGKTSNLYNNHPYFEIVKLGSEEFLPDRNSIDLAFTSPPYFDTEHYSDEETQSYIKYPTQELWLDKFLRKTINNVRRGLKDSGHLIINIANVKSYKNLEEDVVRVCNEEGFKLKDTHRLALSRMNSGFKYEPVFVFEK